ncbi:MAG: hypothetical protein MJ180_05120 [Candidatus Gastranaerophilales bacterium]|nr:hypothetical protein [Candidatus Gastranaerophilales bacterium]
MTDFNNINSEKINQVPNLNFDGGMQGGNLPINNASHKEVKNLDNAHSALVGRSMIHKMEKLPQVSPEVAQSIKDSLASFKGNEKAVTASDAIFNAAVAKGASYKEAAELQQAAVEYLK